MIIGLFDSVQVVKKNWAVKKINMMKFKVDKALMESFIFC